MTEKALDENVAEILGFCLARTQELFNEEAELVIIYSGSGAHELEGFFTENISNCKEHIEPVLHKALGDDGILETQSNVGRWRVFGRNSLGREIFCARDSTEALAYCNALLDLKEREGV